MAELLVALSIFAIISTIGVGALSYMLRTQYQNQTELEKELLKKARASSCLKKIYYSSCNLAIPDDSKCADQYIQTSCLN